MKNLICILAALAVACSAGICDETEEAGLVAKKAKKAAVVAAPNLSVDFAKKNGVIKPLHGINNSPIKYNQEIPELRELGVPFVRLHDTNSGRFVVDIANVFQNFDADPADPASYDFSFTDAYLKSLALSGRKVFYRLGTTIENQYEIKAYRIHPPKDNLKWAKICEGIIRHYNEGWANGFKYGIQYWEIWNEPETAMMWSGTKEQFFDLYETASKYLKKRFPDIKIGGYASCGFYALNRKVAKERLEFLKTFIVFFDDFLKMAAERRAPLDFFSWHIYTESMSETQMYAKYARDKLDAAGFKNSEIVLNEWCNFSRNGRKSVRQNNEGASYCAAMFCAMQDSSIDSAMYYDGQPQSIYCGILSYPDVRPTKTFFAFWAFNKLYELGNCVPVKVENVQGVHACAAVSADGKLGLLLVSNYSPREKRLNLALNGKIKSCKIIDAELTLTEFNCAIDANGDLSMKDFSVALIEVEL